MRKVIWSIVIILIALLVWSFVKSPTNTVAPTSEQKTAKKVKIGFMAPLSGDAASYGESIQKGVILAYEDMGLDNVEIIYEDSKCNGKDAVSVINKLISVDKVSAIVGEVCSGATLAIAPIAEKNKVVLISPASTSPKISSAGDYIFRVVPSDALQGKFGADLVYKKGYRKLAILYSNEDYGVGFEKVLRENFEKLGGKVVASEAFNTDAVDVKTQITKIKSANPDAVYIISNVPSLSVSALKELKRLGVDAAVFASEGLKSEDIIKSAGDSAEGLIISSVSAGTKDFAEKFKKKFGEEPGPFAAQAYDAFKALAIVIKEGAQTGEEIKNALYNLEFSGASGSISFDENGDVAGNYDLYQVKDGKFVKLEK